MRLRRHERLLQSSLSQLRSQFIYPANRARRYISSPSDPQDVAVLGGGITGLATAYYLSKELPKAKITIYEAGPRVGGWLHSKHVEVPGGRVLFEQGPRTLRPGGNGAVTARLIQDLGLIPELIFTPKTSPAARNRYVYYPDHLVRMPGPGTTIWDVSKAVLTEPLFKGFGIGIIGEAFREKRPATLADESIGSFISRRFSRPIAENVMSALVHGIYAGDVWQLSMRSLFALPWTAEAQYGSAIRGALKTTAEGQQLIPLDYLQLKEELKRRPLEKEFLENFRNCSVFTFKNGLQQLADRLVNTLKEDKNVVFSPNTKVESLDMDRTANKVKIYTTSAKAQPPRSHDRVVSTLYSRTLSALCPSRRGSPASTALPSLTQTPAVTVMVVNLYYSSPTVLPVHGFGYLIPQSVPFEQNPERALGVVFDSDVVEGQDTVDGTKLTVMMGGHWWDGWSALPDEKEGEEMARTVLARHLGIAEAPTAVNVTLQRDCIPQYTVGHYERMGKAHGELIRAFGGRVSVAGNSYTGVGVNDCLKAARDVARGIKEGSKTGLERFTGEEKWALVTLRGQGEKKSDEQ